MMTLRKYQAQAPDVPVATAWYLDELGQAKGRQDLFNRQTPQRLQALRQHAMVESAVSSNRIEGVEVDPGRVGPLLSKPQPPRDRDEEELAGYRDALNLIHQQTESLALDQDTIKRLHALARGQVWDAGQYRERESDIIELYPDGRQRVRFKTLPPAAIPAAMIELVDLWHRCLEERWMPPLLGLAAFSLDFLCIHPFRDGNGRISRLLLLLMLYQQGYQVGRYISLERLIEENKERYYQSLEQSSQGWHQGVHDPWPHTNFLLYVLKSAYREMEARIGQPETIVRGGKSQLVLEALSQMPEVFHMADLQSKCPEVSRDLIRQVLRRLRAQGRVECLGRGQAAQWRRTGQ